MPSIAPIARQSAVPLTVLTLLLVTAVPTHAQFSVTNLVTDDQSVNAATITDAHLQNAWGISSSTSSPFWVSANATGLANLYSVNPGTNATTKVAMEVTIPGDGSVTGQTFSNVAGNFNGDTFLFVSEDGTVSGWRGALGTTAETLQVASPNNVYKGATLFNNGGNVYLYAANFRAGTIDVLKGNRGRSQSHRFVYRSGPSGRLRSFQHSNPGWQTLCNLCPAGRDQARRCRWRKPWLCGCFRH